MRRVPVLRRAQKGPCTRSVTLFLVFAGTVVALAWYFLALSSIVFKSQAAAHIEVQDKSIFLQPPLKSIQFADRITCVSWRQTAFCSPFGQRDPVNDKPCMEKITQDSGFCECSGGLTTKRMECGRHAPFTCASACVKLNSDMASAWKLPNNVSCAGQGTAAHSMWNMGIGEWRSAGHNNLVPGADAHAAQLWAGIRAALAAAGEDVVRLPEKRTDAVDWVRDGVHMRSEDIAAARQQWQRFLEEAPSYPPSMFSGRGIVILSGGLTYMVPSWVNLHMLRRTGCQLPVEMWFPAVEYPTPQMETALTHLGVTCRKLPDFGKGGTRGARRRTQGRRPAGSGDMSGFSMKIAALILSQYSEVIFLDSDNVAVADPGSLFEVEEYQRTGALLWPDYWDSSAAPDLRRILGVPSLPRATFESGQMVYDKRRVWRGLLLAAFFNMQASLYYELFSCFMGKGDKESFAHALNAVGVPYHVIPRPVGSVGLLAQRCSRSQRSCWHEFAGNSMTQHGPDGRLMFVHTNLSPKWSLEIPGDFKHYTRRWQMVQPGGTSFQELEASLGLSDLENEVYNSLVALRCAPFLPSYVEALSRPERMGSERTLPLGLPQGSFHPFNRGISFTQAYRWGLTGPFLAFTPVSMRDRFLHWINASLRPALAYIGRVITFMRIGTPQYFDLW